MKKVNEKISLKEAKELWAISKKELREAAFIALGAIGVGIGIAILIFHYVG